MQNQPNPNQISARELYNGCTSEDRKTRERGYEILWRYVYSSALYLVDNPEDAEDLTQSTLAKIYSRSVKLRDTEKEVVDTPDAFKGWIRQVLRNEFIDRFREQHSHVELPSYLAYIHLHPEISDEPVECLFNISQGKKTKWAWIGRYHYGLQDRDLARVESLLCEKSVREDTMFIARSKTKPHWIEAKFVDILLEAKFQPIVPMESDPTLQGLFQQLLKAESWPLLYDVPLDKGTRWAWIGRYIYEMSDEDLARVENLLCNSTISESIMSIRRRQSRGDLEEYLTNP